MLSSTDDLTTPLSDVSSFEGNATNAHDIIARSFLEKQHCLPAFGVAVGEERPSIDTERPSMESTERPSLESARPSSELDSSRDSIDLGDGYSYFGHRRSINSFGGASNRSSLRDYLSMERPAVSKFSHRQRLYL